MEVTKDLHVAQFSEWVQIAFEAALRAGNPSLITELACAALTQPTAIVAVGKAACAMAEGVRSAGFKTPGILITTDENHRYIEGFNCLASSHPVPDIRGLRAADLVGSLAAGLDVNDHLLLLISGGGSALLPAPAAGISLAQKIVLNDALLASGLDIHDMNAIRRLFSRLKGGRLARIAAPAKITQFLLSDVPGDRLESIASGVAVADPVPLTYIEDLVRRSQLDKLDFVLPHMMVVANDKSLAPVRPGDPILERVFSQVLASNAQCRDAASASLAKSVPSMQHLAAPELFGEAQKMAVQLVAQICRHKASGVSGTFGIVAGGETVVTMNIGSPGLGGRSQELALAFAYHMQLAGDAAPPHWTILAGGTDGRDGPTDAAGGVISSANKFNVDAAAVALDHHDSYNFLSSINGLLKTGATGTNLADLVLIICTDI